MDDATRDQVLEHLELALEQVELAHGEEERYPAPR